MRAFQTKGYTCMHLHAKTRSQTSKTRLFDVIYAHIFPTPRPVFWHMPSCLSRQKKKKSTYRRCTCEIRLIQRHYHESIFHTFIFICSYLKTDFSFVSILTHFTPYYHTYHALLEVFIYQSTLDWAFFFVCLFVWVGWFNSDMWFLSR